MKFFSSSKFKSVFHFSYISIHLISSFKPLICVLSISILESINLKSSLNASTSLLIPIKFGLNESYLLSTLISFSLAFNSLSSYTFLASLFIQSACALMNSLKILLISELGIAACKVITISRI